MRKLILTIIIVFYQLSNSFAQIPNGDFEKWEDRLFIEEPVNWTTLNFLSLAGYPKTVTKTKGRTGQFAMQLQVLEYTNSENKKETSVGIATAGSLDFGKPVRLGFPVNSRPESFTGYSKYFSPGKDTALLIIGLSKWNSQTNRTDSVGGTVAFLYSNANDFTSFSAPIIYLTNNVPDTAIIYISSSIAKKPVPGTTLILDDLALTGGTTRTLDALSQKRNNVYPNPAISELTINNIGLDATSITVTNVIGKLIEYKPIENTEAITMNLGSYETGIYFYEFKNRQNQIVQTGKFIVSK